MKSCFLAKLKLLKQKGQALGILRQLDIYIDENIEMFFEMMMLERGKKNEKIRKMFRLY